MKEKIIQKLLSLTYKLDNSGNCDMAKNGELKFLERFSREFPSPTVFDVGANIGEYSNIIRSPKSEIHLFEPQKSCLPYLTGIVNNFGLGEQNETVEMYKLGDKDTLASLYNRNLDFHGLKMEETETIELRRGDEYIEANGVNHINLLKVDVEGHEIPALKGFGKYLNPSFIDYIQFEYGGANLDSHTTLMDFYNLLIPRGFKIAKIMPSKLEVRDYNPRYDNFVYANYVAL